MLDSVTKKRIDNLRDTLVGVLPSPESQVEQITTGLMYKFMSDMDDQTAAEGGERSFFVNGYSQYAFENLLRKKLNGSSRVKEYSKAIESMQKNPGVPKLFRDIFKDAFLSFQDAETLNLFIKGINEFQYSDSEKLGDAFEYLLSFMGSQGDAGQFRTPRHLIDFIVSVVDPQKTETILDPACGTAGFLISAFKHIQRQNDKKLSAQELTTLRDNLVGYDISPDMNRIALVNLYLHDFSNPRIYEHNTLTSRKRWNEYYDVILANPPFYNPKGGIKAGGPLSIKSNSSEMLFVSYIAEHLQPGGRAGIIVPEGIIFQTTNAYKELRKQLVENWGLYAVVSLPNGVFNPYSSVKTSILFLDKGFATDKILFVKVTNDGYGLGARRRESGKDDLPPSLEAIQQWQKSRTISDEHESFAHSVTKAEIAKDGEYNLTGDRYLAPIDYTNAKWDVVTLGELEQTGKVQFLRGITFSRKDQATDEEDYTLVATTKAAQADGIRFDSLVKVKSERIRQEQLFLQDGDILISVANSLNLLGRKTFVKNLDPANKYSFGAFMGLLRVNPNKIDPLFLASILESDKYKSFCTAHANTTTNISNLSWSNLSKFQFPLPPLEVQKQMVAEIDNYQKVIDGAKQVVENWRPQIKTNPDWQMVNLGDMEKDGYIQFLRGITFSRKDQATDEEDYALVATTKAAQADGIKLESLVKVKLEKIKQKQLFLQYGDVLISIANSLNLLGRKTFVENLDPAHKYSFGAFMGLLRANPNRIKPLFLAYILETDEYKKFCISNANTTTNISNLSWSNLSKFQIPLPPLKVQEQITASIEAERAAIEQNKSLIAKMEQKIADKINSVWGD